jgi:transitional endoplasmic reticulum ATPase
MTNAAVAAAPASKSEKDKADERFKNVEIVREGDQITIPAEMSLKAARIWLERKEVEEEQEIAIDEIIEAFPLEGAYAFAKAIARKYGFSALVPTPGFFGSSPPVMIGVDTGVNETSQVPWGRVEIPNLAGYLETGTTTKDNRLLFRIGGEVKQKHKHAVKELANLTRQIVRDESIYRGKAIRVQFETDPRKFNPRDCPKFIDTSEVRVEELIFSDDVKKAVNTSLFTPIEHTANCRKYRIPLKRGILLEGPFGTGKTLTAYVAAKKCVEQKWTFIYLGKVEDLKTAIHFAKSYQPAVIFAEDIDRVMVEGERKENDTVNDILNTIDGVDTKGMELIVCLTTNHVDHIEPAMMRPGRLDAVISVRAPDQKASVDLVKLYSRGRLDNNGDYTVVGEKLSGQIPAVIREVVERSKLAAVSRLLPGEELLLVAGDLEFAADEMLNHLRLMTPKPEDARSDVEKAADTLGKHVAGAFIAKPGSNGKSTESPSPRPHETRVGA